MRNNQLPTLEELEERFICDAEKGILIYASSAKGRTKGNAAGTARTDGYVRVKVGKRNFFAHRIIFFMATGEQPEIIDHINGDKSDNRICNLRPASNSENMCNHQKRKIQGVYFEHGKWRGRVMKNYVSHRIVPSDDKAEAEARLKELRETLHGEFACS